MSPLSFFKSTFLTVRVVKNYGAWPKVGGVDQKLSKKSTKFWCLWKHPLACCNGKGGVHPMHFVQKKWSEIGLHYKMYSSLQDNSIVLL